MQPLPRWGKAPYTSGVLVQRLRTASVCHSRRHLEIWMLFLSSKLLQAFLSGAAWGPGSEPRPRSVSSGHSLIWFLGLGVLTQLLINVLCRWLWKFYVGSKSTPLSSCKLVDWGFPATRYRTVRGGVIECWTHQLATLLLLHVREGVIRNWVRVTTPAVLRQWHWWPYKQLRYREQRHRLIHFLFESPGWRFYVEELCLRLIQHNFAHFNYIKSP